MTVTVYSRPDCVQCRMTLRALDRSGVAYTAVDVDRDDRARAYVTDELGYAAVPVVVVDGDPGDHWTGFRPERIAALGVPGHQPHPVADAHAPTSSGPSTPDAV